MVYKNNKIIFELSVIARGYNSATNADSIAVTIPAYEEAIFTVKTFKINFAKSIQLFVTKA